MTTTDLDIRKVILSNLYREYQEDPETMILEEVGLCQGEARIDIAVVNGTIHGFEIKSDQDSLKRLPGQIEIYSRALCKVTLVVGTKHLNRALKIIPKWWGVIAVIEKSEYIRLKVKRKGKSNPSLDSSALVQLLWRDEAYEALRKRDLHRGLARKPRNILWESLCQHSKIEELIDMVVTALKSRENWRSGPLQA